MLQEKLLKTKEVAELLNVDHSTIKKWARDKKIRAIKIGKQWRIPESEIKKILGDLYITE